jgi:hypothetical protein
LIGAVTCGSVFASFNVVVNFTGVHFWILDTSP